MRLRPLTEDDWAPLLAWNNDPEVLEFAEGDDVRSRTLDEVQRIWRSISVNAHCFLMERDGEDRTGKRPPTAAGPSAS